MGNAPHPRMERIQREFSQPFEIMTIVTYDPPLATLYELQTVYSTADVYDFLEMIDVLREYEKIREETAPKQQ